MALPLTAARLLPALPSLPRLQIILPASLTTLWDAVLRAAPKKKTSYGKKRSRQLAGKALRDTIALNKCPACGAVKRSHLLCPDCVKKIQKQWHEQPLSEAGTTPSPST